MFGLDHTIYQYLTSHPTSELFQNLGIILNKLGKGDALAFLCLLLIIFGYFQGNKVTVKNGAGGILILILSSVVQILKILIGRARPQMNLGEMHFIGVNFFKDGFDSFPSGHATASFALAAFFSKRYPKAKIPFYTVASAIALIGRVYLRHHYFTDIIAGGLLGFMIGFFTEKKLKSWIEEKKSVEPEKETPQTKIEFPKQTNLEKFGLLIVLLFSSIVLFTGLDSTALWDRDETEYAQAVIEMNQKNEWLIPTLEGEPFLEKPIFLYWVTKLSVQFFGKNEFGFRFPCALFGILTCLVAYFLGKVLFGNLAGLYAGLICSSSFLFAGGTRLLMTDPFLIFFTTLSLLFFVYSFKRAAYCKTFLILSYLAMGFAVLSKGPFALFPFLIFLIFEWVCLENKSPLNFFLKKKLPHLLLLIIPITIAFPWFAYSFASQKSAAANFFIADNLLRFLKGSEGHTGSYLYYIPVLLLGLFPWSFFLASSVFKEWKERIQFKTKMKPEIFLLSVWCGFIFIFFSICAHKLPHYLLPAFPALSCLLAKMFAEEKENFQFFKIPTFLTIALAGCLFLAPLALYMVRPEYASLKLILPFLFLFISLKAGFILLSKNQFKLFFSIICLDSLIVFIMITLFSLPWVDQHRVMKPMGLALKRFAPPNSKIFGYHVSEPSLFIYGERLFPKIEKESLNELLKEPIPTYVITQESRLKEIAPSIPYFILDRKQGFAENGGEMSLVLVSNKI
ncbi:MAG: glycosyltransferase family 39 protein [Elusimicrobia bacterium]|nr:glycosyltransferase family 39 protein [Elusimicrobiota bacterium]